MSRSRWRRVSIGVSVALVLACGLTDRTLEPASAADAVSRAGAEQDIPRPTRARCSAPTTTGSGTKVDAWGTYNSDGSCSGTEEVKCGLSFGGGRSPLPV